MSSNGPQGMRELFSHTRKEIACYVHKHIFALVSGGRRESSLVMANLVCKRVVLQLLWLKPFRAVLVANQASIWHTLKGTQNSQNHNATWEGSTLRWQSSEPSQASTLDAINDLLFCSGHGRGPYALPETERVPDCNDQAGRLGPTGWSGWAA